MQLDPEALDALDLSGLRSVAGPAAAGDTPAGPFRLELFAPGIVRLRLGTSDLPDYGLIAAEPAPPETSTRSEGDILRLESGDLAVGIDPVGVAVTLEHRGRPVLGPPTDGHFRRRYRLPCFARTPKGWFATFDLADGEPVYGHGEKCGRVDHRGQILTSWNEDALGVNAEISYKNVPFAWSPRGWGLLVNTPARVTHGVGFGPWSHRGYGLHVEDEALDLFLIAGASPAALLERYTWLTGRPPQVPRWSLGAWLSKAYYKDSQELLAAAGKVRELGLPMDVITLDGRAWLDTRTRFAFEWDASRYPDPAGFAARVKSHDFRLCCWEYPLVSIHHPLFRELADKGWLLRHAETGDPWLHHWDATPFGSVLTPLPTSGLLDFTHPDAYAFWRDGNEKLLRGGVDVIKSDFGEQIPDDPLCIAHNGDRGPRLHNVYPLLYNRCVFDASERHSGTGLVFGRSTWTGAQRYPAQWGGDPQSDWGGLAGSIRGMLSWAASGVPWYASDIGGFYGGPPDAELYVRWCQAAVSASHMRFHGIGTREPWSFGEEALTHVRAALALRYQLIPYIEKHLAEASRSGLPLTRPMALAFPDAPEAWAFDTQYLFGPDLLVSPVLRPGGEVAVWLPEGGWRDWFTGDLYRGPRRLELTLPLGRFPLFMREGAEIGLAAPVASTAEWGDGPIPIAETKRFA